ncbi:CHAT domain-containing protein [Sorangium cellulosum]|uniref:nSTAND1 domain-containing NTPase n=1 Tax=Sorangium cellulosum TaxID=56 RepID=UPI0013311EA3|nr:CHAT domain-containing protein [Sorangium cellulosum]
MLRRGAGIEATSLDLTLDLARAEDTDAPFAFRFTSQSYVMRREDGVFECATFPWDDEVLRDLEALQRPRPEPLARQRFGERLRGFLAEAGRGAREEEIAAALRDGRRVHLTVRSSAAELYALPWELLTLRASGQHLGELPGCLIRYEWPGTETAGPEPGQQAEGGRILFAWSAAGGAVPAEAHLGALRRASAEGYHPFDVDRDVLPHVSPAALYKALNGGGPPVSVLHILCHGGALAPSAEAFGLVWDASEPGGEPVMVDAGALRRMLEPHLGTLRLVVLCSCYGGGAGAPGNALGSVAQALHRAGIPAVVASRYPLTAHGSVALAEVLYRELLVSSASVEDAFLAARERLGREAASDDWASLQLYAREADGPDHRPIVVRPYRGLRPFEAEHRRFFLARGRETEELVKAIGAGGRLVTVVAPSGAGKSSLVRAGLIPAVLEGALGPRPFQVRILHPGVSPLRALAAMADSLGAPEEERAPRSLQPSLAGPPGEVWGAVSQRPAALAGVLEQRLSALPGDPRLLLVVDELEELFTRAEDRAEVDAFVTALVQAASAPGDRVRVVFTLRSNFLARYLELHPELARAPLVPIPPMSDEQLMEVSVGPAERVGLRFEEGLAEALLASLHEGPAAAAHGAGGKLPLLEFALEALWERRAGGFITWEAWEEIGGLNGAIAKRADEVLAGCAGEEQRQLARDLLTRLVHLGRDTEDTRRYASREEIESLAPGRAAGAELERWIRARLLTASEDEVVMAHEAVIHGWGTLQGWLDEDREALLTRQDLGQAARRWEDSGRSPEELWRGSRLRKMLELRQAGRMRLSTAEAAFLEAAQAAAVKTQRKRPWWRSLRLGDATAIVALGAVAIAALGAVTIVALRAARLAFEALLTKPIHQADPQTVLSSPSPGPGSEAALVALGAVTFALGALVARAIRQVDPQAIPITPASAPSAMARVVVLPPNTRGVIRQGPSAHEEGVSGVPAGAEVTVLEEFNPDSKNPANCWYRVQYRGEELWMRRNIVSLN